VVDARGRALAFRLEDLYTPAHQEVEAMNEVSFRRINLLLGLGAAVIAVTMALVALLS